MGAIWRGDEEVMLGFDQRLLEIRSASISFMWSFK